MSHTILHIRTSFLGDHSVTRELGAKTLAALKEQHPDAKIVERNYAEQPLPHLSPEIMKAWSTPAAELTADMKKLVANSEDATSDVMAADTILLETPMYNFGIPSVMKTWIDHIARSGKTFKYTDTGSVGLIPGDKKVIIVSSRGGIYSEGPASSLDHQEKYLKDVLAFMGLTHVTIVRAEGVNMGPEKAREAKEEAHRQIPQAIQKAA